MNDVANEFRRVPFREKEEDHAFRLLRHFPALRASVIEVQDVQTHYGRNWNDQFKPKKESVAERPRAYRSTHHLSELSKSSLSDLLAPMDEMREMMRKSRSASSAGGGGGKAASGLLLSEREAPPLEVAQLKLAKASMSFAPNGNVNVLAGFQLQEMIISEFDTQLRRSLNINLTKKELQALFNSMDVDNSGKIDGVEFTRYFLAMGNIERSKKRVEIFEKIQRVVKESKAKARKEEEILKQWEADQISAYTSEDEARAWDKLTDVALRWDSSSDISLLKLNAFSCFLSPFGFKQQLEKSLTIKLSGSEVGALLQRYSTQEGEYSIDGKSFLHEFIRLRKVAKDNKSKTDRINAHKKAAVARRGQQPVGSSFLGR